MGAILDKVVGPDVVGPLGAEAHARAVVQPEAAALWLFLRDFQPLLSPDPFNPLGVHRPAGIAQQRRDAPIAVPAIGLGQRDDVGGQRRLILAGPDDLALRGAVLTRAAQARRSETPSSARTFSTQPRRRAGLRSFPAQPRSGSACPGSAPIPLA